MTPTRIATAAKGVRDGIATMWRGFFPGANPQKQERGSRVASDEAMERHYRTMWLDTDPAGVPGP